MPFLEKKFIAPGTVLYIKYIHETALELYDQATDLLTAEHKTELFDEVQTIVSENRKIEKIAGRLLIAQMLKRHFSNNKNPDFRLRYTTSGSPYIDAGGEQLQCTVSHTQNYLAVIISRNFRAGVDIESVSERPMRIMSKYLSDSERQTVETTQPDLQHFASTLYWTAKEALFKLYGKGDVDFRKNLSVSPCKFLPSNTFDCALNFGQPQSVLMRYISFSAPRKQKIIASWAIIHPHQLP